MSTATEYISLRVLRRKATSVNETRVYANADVLALVTAVEAAQVVCDEAMRGDVSERSRARLWNALLPFGVGVAS